MEENKTYHSIAEAMDAAGNFFKETFNHSGDVGIQSANGKEIEFYSIDDPGMSDTFFCYVEDGYNRYCKRGGELKTSLAIEEYKETPTPRKRRTKGEYPGTTKNPAEMHKIAKCSHWFNRQLLAQNPNLPVDILKALAVDDNESVAFAAAYYNPKATQEIEDLYLKKWSDTQKK